MSLLKRFITEKEAWAMQKKIIEKNGHKSVWDIENSGYNDARHKKERRKIAPALSQKFSKF
jgi:hypothetical protein